LSVANACSACLPPPATTEPIWPPAAATLFSTAAACSAPIAEIRMTTSLVSAIASSLARAPLRRRGLVAQLLGAPLAEQFGDEIPELHATPQARRHVGDSPRVPHRLAFVAPALRVEELPKPDGIEIVEIRRPDSEELKGIELGMRYR